MKRTNQVQKMVDAVNEYLFENHVKDMTDRMFSDMCYLLTRAGVYRGFNLFTVDGRLSGNTDEFDHLQIY